MAKINIKVSIENNDMTDQYNTTAIIQDNILKYREKDNTIAIYNYDEQTLTRENDELRLNYHFSGNHEGTVYIKELNKEIKLKIDIIQIQKIENNIKINFVIEKNKFLYQIEEIK